MIDAERCPGEPRRVSRVARRCFSVANAIQGGSERDARQSVTRFRAQERVARSAERDASLREIISGSKNAMQGLRKTFPGLPERSSGVPERCSDCSRVDARWLRMRCKGTGTRCKVTWRKPDRGALRRWVLRRNRSLSKGPAAACVCLRQERFASALARGAWASGP